VSKLLLVAIAAALVAAGTAAAKAPITGEVCGKSGCQVLRDPGTLYQALRFEGAFSLVEAPRAQPFYRFTFESDDGFRWEVLWAPDAGLLRADDSKSTDRIYGKPKAALYWRTLPLSAGAALRAAAHGIDAYPAQARWRVSASGSGPTVNRAEVALVAALGVVLLAGLVIARARRSRAPSALRRLRS
jgi:hypothetical protein